MAEKLQNTKQMITILDKCYDLALNGLPKIKSDNIITFAESYLNKYNDIEIASEVLIKNQIKKCGTSGFINGMGGLIIMPITIPANISSVLYFQIRMITAVAYIGGYDPYDEEVQALVYLCLVGKSMNNIAKQAGFKLGEKITMNVMKKKLTTAFVKRIEEEVAIIMLKKLGIRGVTKSVPIAGGVVGASFDSISTKNISQNAINIFIKGQIMG